MTVFLYSLCPGSPMFYGYLLANTASYLLSPNAVGKLRGMGPWALRCFQGAMSIPRGPLRIIKRSEVKLSAASHGAVDICGGGKRRKTCACYVYIYIYMGKL